MYACRYVGVCVCLEVCMDIGMHVCKYGGGHVHRHSLCRGSRKAVLWISPTAMDMPGLSPPALLGMFCPTAARERERERERERG